MCLLTVMSAHFVTLMEISQVDSDARHVFREDAPQWICPVEQNFAACLLAALPACVIYLQA